jgi:homoserine kinase
MAAAVVGDALGRASSAGGRAASGMRTAEAPSGSGLPVAAGVVPVALVPARKLATSRARRLLPDVVPHADAAFNAARAECKD